MQSLLAPTIIAFVIALVIGPVLIPILQKLKFGQIIRDDGPESHLSKQGTPTMGGLLIIISVTATSMLLIKDYDPHILMAFVTFIGFGLIGFIDDALIIKRKQSLGLKAWQKLLMQIVLSTVIGLYTYQHVGTKILIPFTELSWDLGFWIVPLSIFVLVGMSNSVNLTDGLDGLASGVSLVFFATFTLIFASGIVPSGNGLTTLSAALAGGCLGFIFFNRYPAKIFMGDTGSLALGGMVAYMCIISKTILWLPIMGIMFVLSSVSVIIQVVSFKTTGKRVFKMAPLHHHFEQKGYHETTIVVMYIIISLIFCMIGLMAFRL